MFFNGLRESRENEVKLPDMQYNLFIDVMKFIYTGDADIKNADHAIELLST